MGTVVTIDVYTTDGPAGAGLSRQLTTAQAIPCSVRMQQFSTWQPHSPISRLRRGEITSAQAPARSPRSSSNAPSRARLSGRMAQPWAMPGGLDPTG